MEVLLHLSCTTKRPIRDTWYHVRILNLGCTCTYEHDFPTNQKEMARLRSSIMEETVGQLGFGVYGSPSKVLKNVESAEKCMGTFQYEKSPV